MNVYVIYFVCGIVLTLNFCEVAIKTLLTRRLGKRCFFSLAKAIPSDVYFLGSVYE